MNEANAAAKQLLLDFIREKLGGELDRFRTFDFRSLRDSEKFGCPDRRFDCDDTEILRAVYVVLWGGLLPELSMDTLGNGKRYRGDTMNTFHTMFGREIPGRPGFYAGLEKYHPSDGIRERVREFGQLYCSSLGNYVVLPNLSARETTLNCYRGTNQWHDFFDRFLIELTALLRGGSGGTDPILKELVGANKFCFARFEGGTGIREFIRQLVLEDYCGPENGMVPRIVFPLNYHWMNEQDAAGYFEDAAAYLDKAEEIIRNRTGRLLALLREKLAGALP